MDIVSQPLKTEIAVAIAGHVDSGKCFKKGTMHLKFQNEKHWETINLAYAKIKGQVLPESTFRNSKQSEENSTQTSNNSNQLSII